MAVAGLRAWTADDDAFTPAVRQAFWHAPAPWADLAFGFDVRGRLEVVARLRRAVLLGDDRNIDLDDLPAPGAAPLRRLRTRRHGPGLCRAVAG